MKHSYLPQRVILCDGGIGNRLTSLFVGITLLKRFKSKTNVVLCWPINNWCRANALDLFDPAFLNAHFCKIANNVSGEFHYIGHRTNYDHDFSCLSSTSIHNYHIKEIFVEFNSMNIIIESDLIPLFIRTSSIKKLAKINIFSTLIHDKVTELKSSLYKSPTHCLHVRQGDYLATKQKILNRSIKKLRSNNDKFAFYVCSDDLKTIDLLSNLYPKSVYSGSQIINKLPDYTDPLFPERDIASIQLACVEMVYMSSLKLVHTSYSTYLFMAYLLGESCASNVDFLKFKFISRLYFANVIFKRFCIALFAKLRILN